MQPTTSDSKVLARRRQSLPHGVEFCLQCLPWSLAVAGTVLVFAAVKLTSGTPFAVTSASETRRGSAVDARGGARYVDVPAAVFEGPIPANEIAALAAQAAVPRAADFANVIQSVATQWLAGFRAGVQLTSIAKRVRDLTPRASFIGETVLLEIVALCAAQEESPATLAVTAPRGEMGQLAYMVGTRLANATVIALHADLEDAQEHARILGPMRYPRSLGMHGVVAGGTWSDVSDEHWASSPALFDVQLIVGFSEGDAVLKPRALRALLRRARWTVLSVPVGKTSNKSTIGWAIRDALTDVPISSRLEVEIIVLGMLRVPASMELQLAFLVKLVKSVDDALIVLDAAGEHVFPNNLSLAGSLVTSSGQNASLSFDGRGAVEFTGISLRVLISLGLPMTERIFLMAVALRDVQPGPASWSLCCGGVWQSCETPSCEKIPQNAIGIFSLLACKFGLSTSVLALLRHSCPACDECDADPLRINLVSAACEGCTICIITSRISQLLLPLPTTRAPLLKLLVSNDAMQLQDHSSTMNTIQDFSKPLADDVPGLGDLGDAQVSSVERCAHLCRENPRCVSFEFSPTALFPSDALNCQLNSWRAREGVPFRDFSLYIRLGIPNSVEDGLVVSFRLSTVSTGWVPGSEEEIAESDIESRLDFGNPISENSSHGWLCTFLDGRRAVPMSAQEGAKCASAGGNLAWQTPVPVGLYDVKIWLSERPSADMRDIGHTSTHEEAHCTIHGHTLIDREVDIAAERSNFSCWRLLQGWRIPIDSSTQNVVRLSGSCLANGGSSLRRVFIRKTWQYCHPAQVASSTSVQRAHASSKRYVPLEGLEAAVDAPIPDAATVAAASEVSQ